MDSPHNNQAGRQKSPNDRGNKMTTLSDTVKKRTEVIRQTQSEFHLYFLLSSHECHVRFDITFNALLRVMSGLTSLSILYYVLCEV